MLTLYFPAPFIEIAKKKKGIDMSKFAGKVKAFDKIDNVIEWQRRQRDDGTYSY